LVRLIEFLLKAVGCGLPAAGFGKQQFLKNATFGSIRKYLGPLFCRRYIEF